MGEIMWKIFLGRRRVVDVLNEDGMKGAGL